MDGRPARRARTGGLMERVTGSAIGAVMAGLTVALPAVATAADPAPALVPALATTSVTALAGVGTTTAHGVVEAVRQTVLAAQVPGAVVALPVQAGDRVRAGQLLVRLDGRAAEQQAGAAAAQVQAARVALEAATRDVERQRQLQAQQFISPAALDRAEAQFRGAQAQAEAQLAAAGAVRTEAGFHVLRAPYDGLVADVAVVLGDLALPGRALLTLYDPAALRVTAVLAESTALALDARPRAATTPRVTLAGVAAPIVSSGWELLPAADPSTHTMQLRLALPPGAPAVPGRFARVELPAIGAGAAGAARLAVPLQTVVRRAELTGVYVVGAAGRPLLRQVRLGPVDGDRVEVLSGLAAGERVALDPQAAARVR